MSDEDEITSWLDRLAEGEQSAAQHVWEQYCQRLFLLARRKLGIMPRRAADEEDVVLSAFNSFCQAAAVGRFPQLHDRHDLWRVLVKAKLEGYTNDQIAAKLNCVATTVERKLGRIRKKWQPEIYP